jgi:hypothetical protein
VSTGRRVGRVAAYPVIRLLDGRFADVVRRITSVREVTEEQGAKTRAEVARIEPLLASYSASSGEALTFVGTQLRRLADEVAAAGHGGLDVETAFALRALGGVELGARVLDRAGTLAATLSALGFDTGGESPFAAAVCLDRAPLDGLAAQLEPGATVVAALDPGADVPEGWSVSERLSAPDVQLLRLTAAG